MATKRDVHLYCVVRVKVVGIEADNDAQAIQMAENKVWPHLQGAFGGGCPEAEHSEFAEEIAYALVDLHDDKEYEHSKWFEPNPNTGTWVSKAEGK